MRKSGLNEERMTLEHFLGKVGEDDMVDYYGLAFPNEADRDHILKGIVSSLSPARQQHFQDTSLSGMDTTQSIYKKFSPVYFARRMCAENRRGNTTAALFAGAKTLRRVSDGNPRRFIQIMNDMVEVAREQDLSAKNQHRVLIDYCDRSHRASEGLPQMGLVVKEMLEAIGKLLSSRIHGEFMVNGACGFRVDDALLEDDRVCRALELAIAYSLVVADPITISGRISRLSELRLSYLYAVEFWLPMRQGDAIVIRSSFRRLIQQSSVADEPLTPREAKSMVQQLQLEGIDAPVTDTM